MDKEKILEEIRRTANENGGKPLGVRSFETDTGIKQSDWLGKIWARWGDAVEEAGFVPNKLLQRIPDETLLLALAKLTIELDHFPTQPEMNLKRRRDPSFPPPDSIVRNLGNKGKRVSLVIDFCKDKPEFQKALEICKSIAEMPDATGSDSNLQQGHVYLLKHGRDYKIGRSTDAAQRYQTIRVQMPQKTEEVHVIETDDIVGIEAYWHNRFEKKRLNGEWFRLNPSDIKVFKSRKKM